MKLNQSGMQNKDIVTLVIVCDNHLVVMLAALLKSIELNHSGPETISIYVVDDNISKSNVSKINQILTSKNIVLTWKPLRDVIPENIILPLDRTSFPVCAYARLCAPYFLPSHVEKALYLDVDMLVMSDISQLWKEDIKGYPIGAVVDRSQTVSSSWGGIKNYKELGLRSDLKYFNSGLMIINLEKWRLLNATDQVIEVINQNHEHVTFADQYGLNIVFADNWYELDPRWNSYAQLEIEDPFLIHFTGMKPIYKGYSHSQKYFNEFYRYLKCTPWATFKPRANYIRFAKKVWNVLSKKIRLS